MAGTMTLAEHAKIETDVLRASVIDDFRDNIKVMEILPAETTGKLGTVMTKWQALPTPVYKKLNEAFDSVDGTFKQKSETVSLMGFNIDTDKRLARAKNTIADARAERQKMAMKAVGCVWNDKFINGSQVTDPDETNGLKYRVTNDPDVPAGNRISASAAAGGLDVMASAANQHAFLDVLGKMMDALPGGVSDMANVLCFCNSTVLLALDSINRRLGLFPSTKWAFGGGMVRTYGDGGPAFIDMGYLVDDNTRVIPNSEVATGGGAAQCTSIYAARLEEGYLWMHEEYPLEATDMGLLESGVTYRTVVDWPHTLAQGHKRSIVRCYDLYFNV